MAKKIGVLDLLVLPMLVCRGALKCLWFCFALKQQNTHLSVLLRRLENLESTLRPDFADKMVQWIDQSGVEIMSPHHAGDFWGQAYVDVWGQVARRRPNKRFATYTKSLDLDLTPLTSLSNWIVIKSFGGKFDNLIDVTKDHYSRVIHDPKEAKPGEWICPDKGAKGNRKAYGIAKVCGVTCNYCWMPGFQKRLCFLVKRKGWNGNRFLLKPEKMPRWLLKRIWAVSRRIISVNKQFPPRHGAASSGGVLP